MTVCNSSTRNPCRRRSLLSRDEMRTGSTRSFHLFLLVGSASPQRLVSLYIHGWQGRSVSSAPKEKLWPETSTAGLNSHSFTSKPFTLASTQTLLLFLLSLFSLVESTPPHTSHLTQTYSPQSSRRKFLPNGARQCFLPALPGSAFSTTSATALSSSKFLARLFQTSQVLESVPLATLSYKHSIADTLFLVTAFAHHNVLTTGGKSSRRQK